MLIFNNSCIKVEDGNGSKDVYLINKNDFNVLLDKYEQEIDFNYDEIKLFLLHNNNVWTAVDNTSEALLMEDFNSLEAALGYLL